MGNNHSDKDKKEGSQDYERLGPVTLKQIPSPQGDEKIVLMEFSRPIESQKILNKWTQQISRIDDTESRQILLLPEKHTFQKAGLCGSSGHVNLTYENFPYVLDSQIKNRKKLNRNFLQTEMWYLLYNIVRAGNKFERINQKIGDVSPHNVIINDDGQIKVICICSIPNQLNNFQKIVEDKNAKVYLAPQELNEQAINKGIYPSNVDPCKAEVFSIGLTILSSGILQDCFDIYNKSYPRTVNDNILNQYLGILKQNYSPYLFATVTNMLSHPNTRRRASQIYNQLFPYQQNILDLQHFTPYNQPGMHNSIHHQPQVQPQMRQSLNQQVPPYLSQPQQVSYTYNSSYIPNTTTTSYNIQPQPRNVYQDTVPTIYKK